jgi:hypothetical protein
MFEKTKLKATYDTYVTVARAGHNIKNTVDVQVEKCKNQVLVLLSNYMNIERPNLEGLGFDPPDEYKPDDLALGSWHCGKSPTGYCVYHDTNDPSHDFCLFCGDPEERK